jgi:hypothetical protein
MGDARKLPQKRRKYPRTLKPPELVKKAAELHLTGASNVQIGRDLGVDRETVPHMLADSEMLKDYRRRLRDKVPQAFKDLDLLDAGHGAVSARSPNKPNWRAGKAVQNGTVGTKLCNSEADSGTDRQ